MTEPTRITTKRMGVHLTAIYVACAHARKASHATPLTGSLTLLYHGAFLIQETDIITGRGCMAGWSGTDTSALQSQTLSPWESRSAVIFITLVKFGLELNVVEMSTLQVTNWLTRSHPKIRCFLLEKITLYFKKDEYPDSKFQHIRFFCLTARLQVFTSLPGCPALFWWVGCLVCGSDCLHAKSTNFQLS